MKVAYLDLALPLFEDYSLFPKRYGGGRIIASYLKQHAWFTLFCPIQCVDNFSNADRKDSYFIISDEQRFKVANGEPIKDLIPALCEYDIILTCYTNIKFNLTGMKSKLVAWSVGYLEDIHEDLKYLLLYNDYQSPKIKSSNTQVFKFTLGKPIGDFQQREKSDYIFQCTRHCVEFSSIQVAEFCRVNKIKGYFAGPIVENYPLLQYIDNKNTFYLGQIDEQTKMHFTERARLYTMLHNWNTPFNLSAIESLGVGTPVVCTPMGFWPSLISDGYNGFFATDYQSLLRAWNEAPNISQSACYSTAKYYSVETMTSSLVNCFEKIKNS